MSCRDVLQIVPGKSAASYTGCIRALVYRGALHQLQEGRAGPAYELRESLLIRCCPVKSMYVFLKTMSDLIQIKT